MSMSSMSSEAADPTSPTVTSPAAPAPALSGSGRRRIRSIDQAAARPVEGAGQPLLLPLKDHRREVSQSTLRLSPLPAAVAAPSGSNGPRFAKRVNRDCVDIVVEFAACDAPALLQLRGVSRGFANGVGNFFSRWQQKGGGTVEGVPQPSIAKRVSSFFLRRSGSADALLTAMYCGALEFGGDLGFHFSRPAAERLQLALHNAQATRVIAHVTTVDVDLFADDDDADFIRIFAASCPAVKSFRWIGGGGGRSRCSVDRVVAAMALWRSSLTDVELRNFPGDVSGGCVNEFLRHCPKLRTLALHDVGVGSAAFAGLSLPAMTSLTLHRCSSSLSPAGVKSLLASCPALAEVSFMGMDLPLTVLTGGCLPSLTSLHLAHCSSLMDDSTPAALASLQLSELASLHLTDCRGVTDAGLRALLASSPGIRNIYFRGSVITSAAFSGLQLSELTSIHMVGCGVANEGLRALLASSSSLRALTLHATDITSATVTDLPQMSSLTSIDMVGCGVTDDVIRGLVSNARCLFTLSLRYIDITSAAFTGLRLSLLTTIDLMHCHRVTDEGIRALVHNAPHLRSIRLHDCHGVTPGAVVRDGVQLRQTYGLALQ